MYRVTDTETETDTVTVTVREGADKNSEMHSFWGFVARIHTNIEM